MTGLKITGLAEEMSSLARLPWSTPLEEWPEDGALTEMRGISRHVVRLVRASHDPDSEIYAVKETVAEFANREYSTLRELNARLAPCVEPVAVIEQRSDSNGEELPVALATRYLPFSLPYRVILSGSVTPHEITNMANALALLLVRLHLLGFWWGDCSLSNTLFRRDADQYAAYLVDAETGEFQQSLSDGQREHDLEIALFNVAAELEDLSIAGVLHPGMDPIRASEGVIRRYRRLWKMLKEPQILDPSDRHAVEKAMRTLQDLGFAVEEVEVTAVGNKGELRFTPKLVAAGYHQSRLQSLVGITTEELQAKRLLASFDRFRGREKKPLPPIEDSARRWYFDVFLHIVNQVPVELRGRVEPAQMFHEILEHRWYLGEQAGRDLGLDHAADQYITTILPFRTDSGVNESANA
ncbi:unannotated protein [freshwater metagenome]|uniref:Unannotated protein n=1 Tax=freshwater metagenome TaxID=449393 RepID=A0A6J6RFT8_9ZZZZ|nr:DUF4032 domain-containing protein [Actinomycetota bacterium]MSY82436.1 DUF4032 domain-containing protein [Actinomycetota bacterium]